MMYYGPEAFVYNKLTYLLLLTCKIGTRTNFYMEIISNYLTLQKSRYAMFINIFKEGKNDDVDFSEYPVGENPRLRTLVPLGTKFIF